MIFQYTLIVTRNAIKTTSICALAQILIFFKNRSLCACDLTTSINNEKVNFIIMTVTYASPTASAWSSCIFKTPIVNITVSISPNPVFERIGVSVCDHDAIANGTRIPSSKLTEIAITTFVVGCVITVIINYKTNSMFDWIPIFINNIDHHTFTVFKLFDFPTSFTCSVCVKLIFSFHTNRIAAVRVC